MRLPIRPGAGTGSSRTLVWVGSALVVLAQALCLVAPRSRGAARVPAERAAVESEPPAAALLLDARPQTARSNRSHAPRAEPTAPLRPDAVEPPPERPSPAARLLVRVLRAGRPAAEASVELLHEPDEGPAPAPSRHRTDRSGCLALALASGRVRATAWSEDECALPVHAELDPRAPAELELELMPAFPVAGRVVAASSGAPIAGARISLWTFAEGDEVTSGPDGTFLHPRFPSGAPAQQITARAEGFGREVRYLRVGADGAWKLSARTEGEASVSGSGTPWIELALVPELRVQGRVHDARGVPVPGADVALEGFFHARPSVAARDSASAVAGADGGFELRGLRSDVAHALLVRSPGMADLALELAAGPTLVDAGVVTLEPASLLGGTVLDADGLPVAGAEVVLRVPRALPARAAGSRDAGLRVRDREWRTRTDARGGFLFERLAATPCTLSVDHEPFGPVELELAPLPDGSFLPPCLNLSPSRPAEVAAR